MIALKKLLLLVLVLIFCLAGCSDDTSYENTSPNEEYIETGIDTTNEVEDETTEKVVSIDDFSLFDEVDLSGEKFNIYKIDKVNNQLYLLAAKNIATTTFSDSERHYQQAHNYEGSLVETYVDNYVYDLEDKGYDIISSGIIDEEDLYALGFEKSGGLSGLPYEVGSNTPNFVSNEDTYWVGGYCKYETRAWAFKEGYLDTESCDDEYGVRPVIVVAPSANLLVTKDGELNEPTQTEVSSLNIRDIVSADCYWTSEGGIHNPYDSFYFDCDNMVFKNVFESSEMSQTCEYKMEFVDDKTIRVEGIMRGYETPAEITIVSAEKLRIKFVDLSYNSGNYYLNKVG